MFRTRIFNFTGKPVIPNASELVLELPADDFEQVKSCLTFDTSGAVPYKRQLEKRAFKLVQIAQKNSAEMVVLGGKDFPSFFVPCLDYLFNSNGITPLYYFGDTDKILFPETLSSREHLNNEIAINEFDREFLAEITDTRDLWVCPRVYLCGDWVDDYWVFYSQSIDGIEYHYLGHAQKIDDKFVFCYKENRFYPMELTYSVDYIKENQTFIKNKIDEFIQKLNDDLKC